MTVAGMEDSDADLMMVHISDFMYACLTLMYEIGMFRLVNKTFFKINVIGTDLKHTFVYNITYVTSHLLSWLHVLFEVYSTFFAA